MQYSINLTVYGVNRWMSSKEKMWERGITFLVILIVKYTWMPAT